MLVLIGVSAIINLDKSACGEQGGAFFFRQPTTGKMHYCLDIPRVWLVTASITFNYHILPSFSWEIDTKSYTPKAQAPLAAHSMLIGSFCGRISQIRRTSVTSVHFSRLWVKSLWEWTVLGIYPFLGIILTNPQHTQLYGILWYTLCRFWCKQRCLHGSLVLSPTKTTPETIKGMLIWVAF